MQEFTFTYQDNTVYVNGQNYPAEFYFKEDTGKHGFSDGINACCYENFDSLEQTRLAFEENFKLDIEAAREFLYFFSRKDLTNDVVKELNKVYKDGEDYYEIKSDE